MRILILAAFLLMGINCHAQTKKDSSIWLTASPERYTGFTNSKDFFKAQFGFKYDESQVQLNDGYGLSIKYFKFIKNRKKDIPYFLKFGVTTFYNDSKNYIWSLPFSGGIDYYMVGPVAINVEVGTRYFFPNSNFVGFSNTFKLEYGAGLKTGIRLSSVYMGFQLSYRKIGNQSFAHANLDFPFKLK